MQFSGIFSFVSEKDRYDGSSSVERFFLNTPILHKQTLQNNSIFLRIWFFLNWSLWEGSLALGVIAVQNKRRKKGGKNFRSSDNAKMRWILSA